jgi:hypothetical protein
VFPPLSSPCKRERKTKTHISPMVVTHNARSSPQPQFNVEGAEEGGEEDLREEEKVELEAETEGEAETGADIQEGQHEEKGRNGSANNVGGVPPHISGPLTAQCVAVDE